MSLTTKQREILLKKIAKIISEKYFDPSFDEDRWRDLVERHRQMIIGADTTVAFESAVAGMLADLSPNSLGLLSDRTPITPRNAINTSFSTQIVDDEPNWVFQDVLPGGVASKAGLRSGDILVSIDGKPAKPEGGETAGPPFEMQRRFDLVVSRGNPRKGISLSLETPVPKYKDNPYAEPTALAVGVQPGGVGYLRVNLFPGKLGIDFANELDSIFRHRLQSHNGLIIDLRGNPGGGIGGLALMSYLTPERLPIGYSKSRKMAREQKDPSALPVFDKIPRSKLAVPGLAVKFLGRTSIFLYTEALGRRAYRGRIVLLVNEHTTGAAEMVAQFAQENGLAVIVGTQTPGRLVTRSAAKLGFGYRLVLPMAAYVSAKGTQIEGTGITPDIPVPWSFEDAVANTDTQLHAALDAVRTALPN